MYYIFLFNAANKILKVLMLLKKRLDISNKLALIKM